MAASPEQIPEPHLGSPGGVLVVDLCRDRAPQEGAKSAGAQAAVPDDPEFATETELARKMLAGRWMPTSPQRGDGRRLGAVEGDRPGSPAC
jgi:hypothetical protein